MKVRTFVFKYKFAYHEFRKVWTNQWRKIMEVNLSSKNFNCYIWEDISHFLFVIVSLTKRKIPAFPMCYSRGITCRIKLVSLWSISYHRRICEYFLLGISLKTLYFLSFFAMRASGHLGSILGTINCFQYPSY